MQNKKGVSDVITTVLMIVLVVAAISILGVVILNIVRGNADQLEKKGDCLSNAFSYSLGSVVKNNSNNNLIVSIKNDGAEVGSGDKVIVFINGVKNNTYDAPAYGETKSYTISPIAAVSGSVEISPVIGGQQCSASDSETF